METQERFVCLRQEGKNLMIFSEEYIQNDDQSQISSQARVHIDLRLHGKTMDPPVTGYLESFVTGISGRVK